LVLFLLIGSTSGYFGQKWSQDTRALRGTLAKTTQEAKDAQTSLVALTEILKPDEKTLSLDRAVTSVMLDVFNLRVPHGVTVSTAGPSKLGGTGTMVQLTTLAEEVPGTSLKSIKVNIAGSYKNYNGFVNYLEALQQGQVALTNLKIQDESFDISFRIYGGLE
jgi:hypothetical protein